MLPRPGKLNNSNNHNSYNNISIIAAPPFYSEPPSLSLGHPIAMHNEAQRKKAGAHLLFHTFWLIPHFCVNLMYMRDPMLQIDNGIIITFLKAILRKYRRRSLQSKQNGSMTRHQTLCCILYFQVNSKRIWEIIFLCWTTLPLKYFSVTIHMSVFVTSQEYMVFFLPGPGRKKPSTPGGLVRGHVSQALMPVFKTGFFPAKPNYTFETKCHVKFVDATYIFL